MSKKGKDKPPTLADRVYQATFTDVFSNPVELRRKLLQAERFVLKEDMSAFLADLACAAFLSKRQRPLFQPYGIVMPNSPHNHRQIEQMRISARLPHPMTWIEHDRAARLTRQCELAGVPNPNAVMPSFEGWLLEQLPGQETAFAAHTFSFWSHRNLLRTFPWVYYWTTDERSVPWRADWLPFKPRVRTSIPLSVICGLAGYDVAQIDALHSPFSKFSGNSVDIVRMTNMLQSSLLRSIWALLATTIPVQMHTVQPVGGFNTTRGPFQYLRHQTITLQVPIDKNVRTLARQVVANARRRARQQSARSLA